MAYKLRVRNTKKYIYDFIDFLKLKEFNGDLSILSISSFYKDRNSLYYRVYIEIELNPLAF